MVKMKAVYTGGLHCKLEHAPSGSEIHTDAPKDNQGRGERFSPTDLVGAALASCILTTIAIVAERDNVSIGGATAEVEKEMLDNPRRIGALRVRVTLADTIGLDYRAKLERVARQCPAHRSLHPDVQVTISFLYEKAINA